MRNERKLWVRLRPGILGLVMVVALVLGACANPVDEPDTAVPTISGDQQTPESETPESETPEAETPTGDEDATEGMEVQMESNLYLPEELTVPVGTEVTWVNNDTYPHTVTSGQRGSPDGSFDATVGVGESFSYTFTEAGTFPYYCSLHPGMDGTIIVE